MNEIDLQRQRRWQQLVTQIAAEYQSLEESERAWIAERLPRIARLQIQLDQLFLRGNGAQACCSCSGDCCAKGHNHMTLVNLLGYLQHGQLPPQTDFTSPCPFLGAAGCVLTVEQRPYNCISFICDIIESHFNVEEVEQFYALERQLRELYAEFAARYVGAAMTGLLLQEQRLAGQGFFTRKSEPDS